MISKGDDRLLSQLGDLAAEAETLTPVDQELEALASGTLTPAARVALRRRAAGDPGLRRALDAHTPLSGDLRRDLAQRAWQLAATAPARPARRSRRPGRLRSLLWVLLPSLLAPAALLLWLQPAGDGGAIQPDYTLEIEGGVRSQRGPGNPTSPALATPVRLHPGTRLTLHLRPARAAVGPVEVTAVLRPLGPAGDRRTSLPGRKAGCRCPGPSIPEG